MSGPLGLRAATKGGWCGGEALDAHEFRDGQRKQQRTRPQDRPERLGEDENHFGEPRAGDAGMGVDRMSVSGESR